MTNTGFDGKSQTHFSFCHLVIQCESLFGIQSRKSYQIVFLWKSCLAGWALWEYKMEQKGRFFILDFYLCTKMLWIILSFRNFHFFAKLGVCWSWSVKLLAYRSHHFLFLSDFSALPVLNSSWMSNINFVCIFSTYAAEIFWSGIDCHQ